MNPPPAAGSSPAGGEPPSLAGIWHDEAEGCICLAEAMPDGGRRLSRAPLRPFAWLSAAPDSASPHLASCEEAAGPGPLRHLVHARDWAGLRALARAADDAEFPAYPEIQYLVQSRQRLHAGQPWSRLRRCQLDIETATGSGSHFSDAANPADRVLAIGLRQAGRNRLLVLEADDDASERALLERFNRELAEADPDAIEGHNIFSFDLDYLRQRCRLHKVPCAWGRGGTLARFRRSRLKLGERQIDFPRCDLPGRSVVDTLHLVQLHDLSAREMPGYGLKESAVHLGVTNEDTGRTHLSGGRIEDAWARDRARFEAYLADDLREVEGLSSLLLPTYYEQARTFPLSLQDAVLRGNTAKIDLLFLEAYYHARHALPAPAEVAPFEGGFTRSYREGVFSRVLHVDVASLYPSLLLHLGRNPAGDSLGVFVPLLRGLRGYRLRCKQLARSSADPEERQEAQARQSAYKILINSFYGYLGFPGARFADGGLAAQVTAAGRELLQALIGRLGALGCEVLEADTDGIYLSDPIRWDRPEELLAELQPALPPGIDLELDGRYEGMVCYKSKNYALREGGEIVLRGSALRSRGTEPFLRKLTSHLLRHLLGLEERPPLEELERLRREVLSGRLPVSEVAKSEHLGQHPQDYRAWVAGGGKPRRAALEAAQLLQPPPRMGDRISYFLAPRSKGCTADWQRARPLETYDPVAQPYDGAAYAAKLEDWRERYAGLLGNPPPPSQGELFG